MPRRTLLVAGGVGSYSPPIPVVSYIACAHTNDEPGGSNQTNHLWRFVSDDGIAWTASPSSSIYPSSFSRDPSLMVDPDGTEWIVAQGPGGVDSVLILKSTDGGATFSWVAEPSTAILSPSFTWAAEWFIDVDDSIHVVVPCKVSGSFKLYEFHPTNEAMTTWSTPVQITGTGFATNCIDPSLVYDAGTYSLFYKNDSAGTICLATSSTPWSGYTTVKTGDWAGWKTSPSKSSIEGPVLTDDGTTWRMYFTHNSGFDAVHIYYSETTDRTMMTGWSTATSLPSLDGYNHALPIRVVTV